MATRASTRFSPALEAKMMDRASEFANNVVAAAIDKHGPLEVLVPLKRHWNAATGNEFGQANQAALQAVALDRGFESLQWASKKAITDGGGTIKEGEASRGAQIIAGRSQFTEVEKKDKDGNVIINPETGKPDKVKIYASGMREVVKKDPTTGMSVTVQERDPAAKRLFYAMSLYNIEQTENFKPHVRPLVPTEDHRLPDAVKGVWSAVKMPLPTIKTSDHMNYDMETDTLTLPPLEAFKDPRPRTFAAFNLAKHLAYSAAHPSRLNLREFSDPDLYMKNSALVEIAATGAAGMIVQNHSKMYDPKILQAGNAEIAHMSDSLKNRSVDLHFAMADAVKLYGYMTQYKTSKI